MQEEEWLINVRTKVQSEECIFESSSRQTGLDKMVAKVSLASNSRHCYG